MKISTVDLLKTYQDPHRRFLFLEIKVKNSFLTIANIYGPNVNDSGIFKNMFGKLNDFSKNEILVGGDFIMILDDDLDKRNGLPHKNKLIGAIRNSELHKNFQLH